MTSNLMFEHVLRSSKVLPLRVPGPRRKSRHCFSQLPRSTAVSGQTFLIKKHGEVVHVPTCMVLKTWAIQVLARMQRRVLLLGV